MEDNNHKKRLLLAIFLIMGLVGLLIGVTYAFFNYTRTGIINNIGTGRIYFNMAQNGKLELSNIFPVKSTEVNENELDSVTVGIVGDTTYHDGEEYLISLVDVNNIVNGKKIPLNYIATYEALTDKVIGTENNDYWNERDDKNTNIYLLNETGSIVENRQVLVGFIKNDNEGINGTLTIKAYIDADRIAISDTYPNKTVYEMNSEMTNDEKATCVSYLTSIWGDEQEGETVNIGETYDSFCSGSGKIWGNTFLQWIDDENFSQEDLNYFEEHNIINVKYTNDTTDSWVGDRVVFTTEEWNSMQTTPISFQIRAESNEGIWVDNVTPSGCFKTSSVIKSYLVNASMTETELNTCVSYFNNFFDLENHSLNRGETLEAFCQGTGTVWTNSFQKLLNTSRFSQEDLEYLEEQNIIIDNGYGVGILDYDTSCGNDVIIPKTVTAIRNNALLNHNMTESELNTCVSYFNDIIDKENVFLDEGETVEAFCQGTGTISGITFQQILDYNEFESEELEYLEEHNIISNNKEKMEVNVIQYYSNVFYDKSLTSVEIPNSVTNIDSNTFSNNNIATLSIDMENIPDRLFYNSGTITNLTIGKHVKTIGQNAFFGNNITTVNIDMENIPEYFSSRIGKITNLTIGEHVKTIGREAFFGDDISGTITIPDSVTEIGEFAFLENSSLTEIIVSDNLYNSLKKDNCDDDDLSDSGIANIGVIMSNKSGSDSCEINYVDKQ